jgi:hypothetical protein
MKPFPELAQKNEQMQGKEQSPLAGGENALRAWTRGYGLIGLLPPGGMWSFVHGLHW